MKCDKYMGMDVHQAMTVVAVLDADGKVILETMVATEAAAIIRLVQGLSVRALVKKVVYDRQFIGSPQNEIETWH
jgi:hypothetical protein